MKKILPVIVIVGICWTACDRKPYVEHKFSFEKVADNCAEQQSYFRMVSNFGGERYEFEKCLPSNFTKDQLISERQGDTVLIRFDTKPGQDNKVYHLVLDIDSYPRYHFLTIGDDTYSITPSLKK